MEDLSLHILDIAENSVRAKAALVTIVVKIDKARNELRLSIRDDGQGMSPEVIRTASDPFFTTKESKSWGLGLPLLKHNAQQAGGDIRIESSPGKGTKVEAWFTLNHPDMIPLGDLLETIAALIGGNPDTRFVYEYDDGIESVHFDSQSG